MSPLRKAAAVYLVVLVAASILASVFWTDAAIDPQVSAMMQPPSFAHWFGTDSLGRDLLAKLLIGARISLAVGLAGSLLSVSLGLLYGLVSGWRGGGTDRWFMRGADLFQSIPSFMLVAIFCLALNTSLPLDDGVLKTSLSLVLGISLTHWMTVARMTRGLVLRARTLPYVEAARALGGTEKHILRRHVVPHLVPSLAILLGLQIPSAILYESFMSFIGVGIQPPDTSWGVLVQEGWRSLGVAPHLALFPALVLFLTVWSLHLLFDPFGLSEVPSAD